MTAERVWAVLLLWSVVLYTVGHSHGRRDERDRRRRRSRVTHSRLHDQERELS